MKKTSFLSLVLLFLCACPADAQRRNSQYLDYIEKYKDEAVEQMQRYHIPASITLAQGLLESGSGNSTLALKSNNHFGIKCHNWNGKRIYHNHGHSIPAGNKELLHVVSSI